MNITCVIPARLASTRLHQKILQRINSRTLLEHTWRAVSAITKFNTVIIALDDPKTAAVVESFGGTYVYTSPTCPSGTHRLIEVAIEHDATADVWVNWQADEPFIPPAMIHDLLHGITDTCTPHVWTLKTRITNQQQLSDPHTVKVACGASNAALYFSRAPIPYYRTTPVNGAIHYAHIGLYAYTTSALKKIAQLPACLLAQAESLEQLQFLSGGIPITAHTTMHHAHGIDTPSDLKRAIQRQ